MLVTNYKKIKEILEHKGNREKFLQLLRQGLNEEIQQRKEEELTGKDILKETLLFFSNDLNSSKKIKAKTFFRVLARKALNNHNCWATPKELYEKLTE